MEKPSYPPFIRFALAFMLMLATLTPYIHPVHATGTVYILSDGSVSPSDAPISAIDTFTYKLTRGISDSVVVERSNIVIDGNAHMIRGDGTGFALKMNGITNVTIKNTNVENFSYGIYIESASSITVQENNITLNSYDGVGQFYSTHVTVTGNNISSNGYGGIEIYNSTDSTISGNQIASNSWQGVGVHFSSTNTIFANNLTNNLNGIEFAYSENNAVFHNDFINHTRQATIVSSTGTWDHGYPSGGNYWADNPNRTDNYRGPYQDQSGSDGIGDTGYTIDVSDVERARYVDHYPLTKPYGGLHDIGLTKGPTTKTAISQGKDLNVTIIIINYGFTTETFNAAAYFDTTQLVQTQITLTSRSSTSLSFILNTTDLTRSNHTITAYADPVPDETAVTDNTLNSWVVITFLGDINGDGRVDMKDIGYVARCFGSTPTAPLWDPNADIDGSGRVDMKDIGTAAKHFGEHYP